jgi:hypothetical protein
MTNDRITTSVHAQEFIGSRGLGPHLLLRGCRWDDPKQEGKGGAAKRECGAEHYCRHRVFIPSSRRPSFPRVEQGQPSQLCQVLGVRAHRPHGASPRRVGRAIAAGGGGALDRSCAAPRR